LKPLRHKSSPLPAFATSGNNDAASDLTNSSDRFGVVGIALLAEEAISDAVDRLLRGW
jgi:hypothetical protein